MTEVKSMCSDSMHAVNNVMGKICSHGHIKFEDSTAGEGSAPCAKVLRTPYAEVLEARWPVCKTKPCGSMGCAHMYPHEVASPARVSLTKDLNNMFTSRMYLPFTC